MEAVVTVAARPEDAFGFKPIIAVAESASEADRYQKELERYYATHGMADIFKVIRLNANKID